MSMDFGLYQQQSMKLVMTNELRQAISILQYSAQELLTFIEEQQLDNPLLEIQEKSSGIQQLYGSGRKLEKNKNGTGETSPFDYLSKTECTLQEHLINQVRFMSVTTDEKRTLRYLIYSLDENGYFTTELDEVAKQCAVSVEEALISLNLLQSLDPIGVGARSLQECLLLQLRQLKPRNTVAEQIIAEYLQPFANKSWRKIAKALSITIEEIQTVADFIQALQPKPGAIFHAEPPIYIIPDMFIEMADEKFYVFSNDYLLPKLSTTREYHQLLQRAPDERSLKYLQQKQQQIFWLKKSVEQRQQTLLKVTEAIANYQKDFFRYGFEWLKPLTLKDIADETELHESTVSRATTRKYVQTPRGLFELKFFFSSSLKGEAGSTSSSTSVKQMIKNLITEENKQKPLSDQKIALMIKSQFGIDVSRRTVTKYRELLNIPSSTKRKRF